MTYDVIAGPLIGAFIGYCTNYIAVRMLFRPLRPVKIGSFTLPFTPGIIPKGKNRLGQAIGVAIGETLLTEEELTKTMLSDDMKQKVASQIRELLESNRSNQKEIGELIKDYTTQDVYEAKKAQISSAISEKLVEKAMELSVGTMIAKEAVKVVKEKVKGSLLEMMINDQLLNSFAGPISEGIDHYIQDNGNEILEPQVRVEIDKITTKTIGNASEYLNTSDINIEEIVVKLYEQFVLSRMSSILKQIDISSIVERKIAQMDVMELEQLVLSVMKKELNAVVNLGAIIGFILGLFNLVF